MQGATTLHAARGRRAANKAPGLPACRPTACAPGGLYVRPAVCLTACLPARPPAYADTLTQLFWLLPQLLAIDHGMARIGLAVCDASWSVVAASKVLDATRAVPELRAQILALCSEHDVGGVVVGWPLHPHSGKPTPQCVKVAAFMEALRLDALPKTLWDERYSSQLARHEAVHEPLMDLEAGDGRARSAVELRGHRRALRSARALASDWRHTAVDDVAAKVVLDSFLLRQGEARQRDRRPGATG